MLKKIETMVMGIGELSLDAISTWFPSKSKEVILKEIEKSDVIGIMNNQVMAKSKIKEKQKANVNVKNKDINLAKSSSVGNKNKENKNYNNWEESKYMKNVEKPVEKVTETIANDFEENVEEFPESVEEFLEDDMDNIVDVEFSDDEELENEIYEELSNKEVAAKEEVVEERVDEPVVSGSDNISYEELVKLINKYNEGVKQKYSSLVSNNFDNKKQAIIEYYKKRFNVVKNDFDLGKGHEVYSLLHKKNMLEVAYLYIGEVLTKEAFDKICNKFVEDTVYFCVTKDAEIVPNISNREYYLKDVEEIIDSYLNKYELIEEDYKVLKIK